MNIATLSTVAGLIATVGGGGYWAANNLADKAEVQVVAVKADFAIDKHAEYLLAQINRLESKRGKTAEDLEQLRYLREELKRLREIRQGEKR